MNEREKSNRKIEEWKDPTIGGEEDRKRNAPEKIQKTKKEIRRESCGKRNEFIVRFLLIAMTDILRSNPTGICFNGFILITFWLWCFKVILISSLYICLYEFMILVYLWFRLYWCWWIYLDAYAMPTWFILVHFTIQGGLMCLLPLYA